MDEKQNGGPADQVQRLRSSAKIRCSREEGEHWEDRFEWKVADTIEAQVAQIATLRKALANAMGHLDTPIARRRLGIDPDAEWLLDARAAYEGKADG